MVGTGKDNKTTRLFAFSPCSPRESVALFGNKNQGRRMDVSVSNYLIGAAYAVSALFV